MAAILGPVATGLWQMADQERDGRAYDLDAAANALAAYGRDGFLTWDMADHYGSAEIVAGKAARLLAAEGGPAPTILTKWCPEPGPMDRGTVRAAVERALDRTGGTPIAVMQLHWWRWADLQYLDALEHLADLASEGMIGGIGLTNVDAAHLRMLCRHGLPIATNQVSFSLVDRRAAGPLSEAAAETGVRLLAYGTLCGGFLTDRWVGAPAPEAVEDWSRMKYRRFIDTAGGWTAVQGVLAAAARVAARHGVPVSTVATAWVLGHPAVASVIVGARLTEREHRAENRRIAEVTLTEADRAEIAAAQDALQPIPGDCGDEYRRPPYLTASGDLSHHLASLPAPFPVVAMPDRAGRKRAESGSTWEAIAGFSRAVRVGDRILVSGTTAPDLHGNVVCEGDPEGQAVFILDKIVAAVIALGGAPEDVVRTRILMVGLDGWEGVSRAHAAAFGTVRPANTLVEIAGLIGPYLVEIEAEAVVG